MTDISDIQPAESRPVQIRHPANDEPVGLTIHMRPSSHPEVEKVRRRNLNQRLSSRNNKITAEQIEANNKDLIVAAATDWEWTGDLTLDGEQPEYSDDALRRLMKKAQFVRDQLQSEMDDEASFYEG